ncbi:Glycosyl transferase [Cryptosporidium felis]|nr:Glycosyl transferase [Cryptosporidium felis]
MYLDSFNKWKKAREHTVAFFHPQCMNFGGGEKVLWNIVYEVLVKDDKKKVVIYSCNKVDKVKLLADIKEIFDIPVDSPEFADRLTIVALKSGFLLKGKYLKLWSINLGAMIVSLEALVFCWPFPKVFIETAGYPFAIFPARILPSTKHIATYIHYPQVRKDTIEKEKAGNLLKYLYLKLFSWIYYLSIKFASKVVVNSNWTRDKFIELWGNKVFNICVCYPPINVNLHQFPNSNNPEMRKNQIFSLSQFRKEKNHFLQIKVFSEVLQRIDKLKDFATGQDKEKFEELYKEIKFKMCGTSQISNIEYNNYIDSIRKMIKYEGLEEKIELLIDSNSDEIQRIMNTSRVALHTMEDEHFGICVAEFISSGLVTIAHKSGGPEKDILKPYKGKPVGFLASNSEEFVESIISAIVNYNLPLVRDILQNARESASERFQNNRQFGKTCCETLNI